MLGMKMLCLFLLQNEASIFDAQISVFGGTCKLGAAAQNEKCYINHQVTHTRIQQR